MRNTAGELRTNSLATFFYGLLHTDVKVFVYQQEPIYNSSVRKPGVFQKACWKGWMIETNRERESGRPVLAAWHHDDDDDDDDDDDI